MWVLYEAHIRVIRSGAVDGSATPKYHYIPNSGVIRVESEYDSPNTAPSLKEILPPSESVPHTSVTYLRGLLTKIPAPALMGASAATADACLADMWNALDGPQGEGGSGLGSSEVYAIVVAVEGTWGSPLELNVGYIWRRSEQDHWRVRRGPRPAAGMFKNAGWYCLTVMVASLRNTTLGARDSQKVLSTSFVITDPHSDHSHSELGVTPISLKQYPHWPPSLSAALLTLRPVAVVDGADTPMLIFDTDKSARLKSVEGIIETLITAVPPSHDDGSMVATYSTKNGSSMLEVLHREARQCFDPTRDGSGACVPVFGGLGSLVVGGSAEVVRGKLRRRLPKRGLPVSMQVPHVKSAPQISSFEELIKWWNGGDSDVAVITASIVVPTGQVLSLPHGNREHASLSFCETCSLVIAGSLLVEPTQAGNDVARLLLSALPGSWWGGVVVEPTGRLLLHDSILTGTGSSKVKRMKGTGTHIKRPPAITVSPVPLKHGMSVHDLLGDLPSSQVRLSRCGLVDLSGPGLGLGKGSTAVLDKLLVQAAAQGLECVECTISVRASVFVDIPFTFYSYDKFRDEDNDGLYFRGGHAEVVGCMIANTADDGIDSACNSNDPKVSTLTVRNSFISNIQHEGIALSGSAGARRNVTVDGVVVEGCQQGIENGHSPETHYSHLKNVLLVNNQVGIRFGDDYKLAVEGALRGERVFFGAPGSVPGFGNVVPYADIVISEMKKHMHTIHHGRQDTSRWVISHLPHYKRLHALFECAGCVLLMEDGPASKLGWSHLDAHGEVCGEPLLRA